MGSHWFYRPGLCVLSRRLFGRCIQPALAIGITAIGLNAVANIWIHLIGELAGGDVATVTFRLVSPDDVQRAPSCHHQTGPSKQN